MSVEMVEAMEDDYVVVEMAVMSLEPQEGRPAICNILLKDGSIIKIYDKESVKECRMLQEKFQAKPNEVVNIQAGEYDSDHVRFVLNFAALPHSGLKGFTDSDEFKEFFNRFEEEELRVMMNVANFFQCDTALMATACLHLEKLKVKNRAEREAWRRQKAERSLN